MMAAVVHRAICIVYYLFQSDLSGIVLSAGGKASLASGKWAFRS
jgi:hypothetical protein